MRKAKKSNISFYFSYLFLVFNAIAQTQYTADDYEKVKIALIHTYKAYYF